MKREVTEKELRDEIAALHARAEEADDVHRIELEKVRAALNEEIRLLRDRSHVMSGDVQTAVTRTAINAEMVAEIRNELRSSVTRTESAMQHIVADVGSMKTTIAELKTVIQERMPGKKGE